MLIPILLNLKGNLEMNLAARLSTSANIGELDLRLTRRSIVFGNLALLQVQALLVSLLAGLLAYLLGWNAHTTPTLLQPDNLANADRPYFVCAMVLCASMLAASFSSAIVGAFMCSLVILSRRLQVDPDNFATPLAASLGDLLSLTLLGLISTAFVDVMGRSFGSLSPKYA